MDIGNMKNYLPAKAGSMLAKLYYTISLPIAKLLEKSVPLSNFTRKYVLSILVNSLKHKRK